MEKTLGQIYHDAQWSQYDYENADKWCNEREAAGIAAVARHVFGELLAAHVAECHATDLEATVRKVLCNIKIGGIEFVERPKPVEPPQADADDWVYAEITNWHVLSNGVPTIETRDLKVLAEIIREAAERHYAKLVDEWKQIMNEQSDDIEKLTKERDASRAEVEKLKESLKLEETSCLGVLIKIGNLLQLPGPIVNPGKVLEEVERLVEQPTPPASTGNDELMLILEDVTANALRMKLTPGERGAMNDKIVAAIRPLFDALRRERDEAIKNLDEADVLSVERLVRAEAAESELAELRAACEWCVTTGCSPSTGKDGRWRSMFLPNDGIEAASMVDAILAAYRNTKAASAAEGAVK